MARCGICGNEFDPLGFQVVVPELGAGFDRIECARQARRLAPVGTPPALLPLAAIAEPAPAGASGLLALAAVPERERRPLLGAAALGLLAAGTAASVFLWLRILGPAPSGFSLPASLAPSAVERRAVAAQIAAPPEAGAARPIVEPGGTTTRLSTTDLPAQASGPPERGTLLLATAPTRPARDKPLARTPERAGDEPAVRPAAGGPQRDVRGKALGHVKHGVPPGPPSGHGKGKKLGHSKHK